MKSKTIMDVGEHDLLQLIRRRWGKTTPGLVVGMGDDAAVFELDAQRRGLATCDLLIEEVHFERSWITPKQLGHKALAVNLSDIAAMGGIPRFALISLGVSPRLPLSWLEEFYQGLGELAERQGVVIAGGDTCSSTKIIINITVLGEVQKDELLLRSGAKVGNQILVTGTLGQAAAGLAILQTNQATTTDSPLIRKQLQPEPRCREARVIAASGLATAMLDLSDGLATDITNLTQASQVGARVWLNRLPISGYLKERAPGLGKSAHDLALCGGEDYELLLSAPPSAVAPLQKALAGCNCPLTVIGEILPAQDGLQLLDAHNNSQLWPQGYQHFQ